jgi:hypothetical protein
MSEAEENNKALVRRFLEFPRCANREEYSKVRIGWGLEKGDVSR